MSTPIPTYRLRILSQEDADMLLVNQRVEVADTAIHEPYRSTYYGVGVCLAGTAVLRANLETYAVAAGWMIVMPPHVIKQWVHRSADFHTLTVFFTTEFMRTALVDVNTFSFFDNQAQHAFLLSAAQLQEVETTLHFLQQKQATHQTELVQRIIHILLSEVEAIYVQQRQTIRLDAHPRAQWLTAEFKKLVNQHCAAERGVGFYADKLCITANHLSETVRQVTGKTAGEWLREAIMLEAKVLLQNPTLSIAQVANRLQFADQSAFGKFFKQAARLSPSSYRQGLQTGDSVF